MGFQVGDKVRSKSDPSRIGMIEGIGPRHAGHTFFHVFWGAQGTRTTGEFDLIAYTATKSPSDSLRAGVLSGYAEFQRLMTLQRLLREDPLRNNVYAFNASRTQFFAYQFKPLLKLLESANHRILICDEVGLGKTIEAGLLLLELRARQTLRTVLVVCPPNLRYKWRLELRQRFGEEFKILQTKDLRQFLDDFEDQPDRVTLNGIVSYETLRTVGIRTRLEELSLPLDFVIVDEAHHVRNFGTNQRHAVSLVTAAAQAVAMLTATPVHLGQSNLFSLLNLLDSDDFPDLASAEERFRDNEHIVQAQRAISLRTPDFRAAATFLELAAASRWTTRVHLVHAVREKLLLAAEAEQTGNQEPDRALLLSLQRDLGSLNLLGHILTRTRKRDVHEHAVARRALAIEVEMTARERALYDGVTALVRDESARVGETEGTRAWRLNTPQRRLASSIAGMVEFYREEGTLAIDDDDSDGFDGDATEAPDPAMDPDRLRAALHALVVAWPPDEPDSKYEKLRQVLGEMRDSGRTQKILIFATFKHTIRYLALRLAREGFGVVAMSGDTPAEERPALITRFREDQRTTVMVSSRVGSEGLDFQFCSVLVNYDLPWNPMEVEQRIGRLDRIGQDADSILIVNFWTTGTIEERILKRLYERVGIFERSIGDLDVILGEIAASVQRELVRASLRPEETERAVEQVARVIEERKAAIATLEASAARFVGADAVFDEEVDAIRKKRRYVTSEQLFRFVLDFLLNHAPRTRLEYDRDTNLGVLIPDEILRGFLRQSGYASDALTIVGGVGTEIAITFDAQVAYKRPGLEFLSVLHPLITAIAEAYVNAQETPAAQHVFLRSDRLPSGFYFFFVFRVRMTAARAGSTLETVILDARGDQICSPEMAEELLGEMVERGEAPTAEIEIEPEVADAAIAAAEIALLRHLASMRIAEEAANDAFVDQRLASLQAFFEKTVRQKNELLERGVAASKQQRYLRMLGGQITRLETEYSVKRRNLERLRVVTTEHIDVAAGVLEISATQ